MKEENGGVDDDEKQKLMEWKKKREERQQQRKKKQQQQQQQSTDDNEFGDFLVGDNEEAGGGGGGGEDNNKEDKEEEDVEFVPISKKRRLEKEALMKETGIIKTHRRHRLHRFGNGYGIEEEEEDGNNNNNEDDKKKKKKVKDMDQDGDDDNKNDYDDEEGDDNSNKDKENENENNEDDATKVVVSLLDQATALHKTNTQQQQQLTEAERILKEATRVQTNALQAASELAEGKVYTKSLPSSWTPPTYILKQGPEVWQQIRSEWHMQVQGIEIPPPCKRFEDMKLPLPILQHLKSKNINKPTPIQMQGLTVALAGRDMIGIAFTGSGKTLTFSLPMVMAALEEELRMSLLGGEGPIGIVLAPSRELAKQTFDVVNEFCTSISEDKSLNVNLRAQLLMGGSGESVIQQLRTHTNRGIHCVVATPGRLKDVLKRKKMNLDICRYIALDEADRMLDYGFDEEVSQIMNSFTHQRQTLLFSATFPKKFQDFARETLIKPIVVNVGRAGAANLDVIQEVEYVKQEAKIVYLLHCLQKTAPPVIIFADKQGDVDDIHEYLLLKGVHSVSIHGGKDQADRNMAIAQYKDGSTDVLVATDVAAKGLDFQNIQHVINFDMPDEIENYVHRIGRTGRCGKTGVATTFINKSCSETTLLDLKHLLKEAKQRIPPVLMMLDDPEDNLPTGEDGENGEVTRGCLYCGGLGHTVVDCPKIDKNARSLASGRKDALATGGGYGGGGDW